MAKEKIAVDESAKQRRSQPAKNEDSPGWHLRKLTPFIAQAARGTLAKDARLDLCVRASLVKSFEFCIFSHGKLKQEYAFHCVGGLRSICEDLIVLKFISRLSLEDQQTLLFSDTAHAISSSMRYQAQFFDVFRLGQPVLRGGYPPESLSRLDAAVDDVWRRSGWPRAKDGRWPPTEQLARKVGQGTVDVIYDYIFRLTSGTVHFSTRSLFRTGWGPLTPDAMDVTFSTKNMSAYYIEFCRIYGIFLLSIYFEFFSSLLGVPPWVETRVQKMRVALAKQNRWPEMLTFEEANKDLPKGGEIMWYALQQVLAEEFKDGFILRGEALRRELTAKEKRTR